MAALFKFLASNYYESQVIKGRFLKADGEPTDLHN